MDVATERFIASLEKTHTFPCQYIFKFIVPTPQVAAVEKLTSKGNFAYKKSKSGTYTSVSITLKMQNSHEVISLYQRASKIAGCISL